MVAPRVGERGLKFYCVIFDPLEYMSLPVLGSVD